MAVANEFAGMANRLVIRLAGRLNEQDRLSEIVFAVIIGFTVLGAGFAVMKEMEARYQHYFYETDINFELTTPPPLETPVAKRVATLPLLQHQATLEGSHSIKAQPAPAAAARPQPAPQTIPAAAKLIYPAAPIADIKAGTPPANIMPASAPASTPPAANAATGSAPLTAAPTTSATQAPTSEAGSPGSGSGSFKLQPDMTSIAGADFGAQHGTALTAAAPKMGNIHPYKVELLRRLAQSWHPAKGCGRIVLELAIGHDGKLLGDRVLVSSGNNTTDKDALKAVEATEFAPLPDWFKGDHLIWKLDLSTINVNG